MGDDGLDPGREWREKGDATIVELAFDRGVLVEASRQVVSVALLGDFRERETWLRIRRVMEFMETRGITTHEPVVFRYDRSVEDGAFVDTNEGKDRQLKRQQPVSRNRVLDRFGAILKAIPTASN